MSPEQALQIIDQVTSVIQATRSDHQKIEEALVTLQRVVADKVAKEPDLKDNSKPASSS